MDRSKVQAVAGDAVVFVASPDDLVDATNDAVQAVVVDLSRPGVLEALPALAATGIRTIGFGSHVDRDLLEAARTAGCREVLPRSEFFRRLPELIASTREANDVASHRMRLGGTGIWSAQLRFGEPGAVADASAELDELGYSALWIPDVGGDVFTSLRTILDATRSVVAATGILNVWMHTAEETAAGFAEISGQHPNRLLLGLGVSHAPLVDASSPGRYRAPLRTMREYLDALDAAEPPVPATARVLAALGPRMLELARDRSAGAHPYLVPPEHTRTARELLGADAVLAPEQAVVLETDPSRARELARGHLSIYLTLPNYTNNLRGLGFTEEDLADGGSDRLVDGIVVWGDEDAARARVQQHRDAGADHVAVQVVTDDFMTMPMAEWRRLATALV